MTRSGVNHCILNIEYFSLSNLQMNEIVLILYSTKMPHLIYLRSDFTVRFKPMCSMTGNVSAVFRHGKTAVIIDDTGRMFGLEGGDGEETLRHQFESPVSANHDMKDYVNGNVVICGLRSGRIVFIGGDDFSVTEQFEAKLANGEPRYGVAHFVYAKNNENYGNKIYQYLVVACTNSHLLLLAPDQCSDDSVSEESKGKSHSKTNKPAPKNMKLVLRVKKKYHMVEITSSLNLLIAASGGQLDLFQVGSIKIIIITHFIEFCLLNVERWTVDRNCCVRKLYEHTIYCYNILCVMC